MQGGAGFQHQKSTQNYIMIIFLNSIEVYIFGYIVFHIFLKHSQNIDNIAIRCDQSFPYAKSIGNIQLYKAQLEIENVALEVQC